MRHGSPILQPDHRGDAIDIESIPDEPPKVELEGAPQTVKLTEVTEIPLRYRVTDDHGLTQIDLVIRVGDKEEHRVLARHQGQEVDEKGSVVLHPTDPLLRAASPRLGTSLDDARLDGFVKDAAYPIYLKDIEWDSPWSDTTVGPSRYVAKVRHGHGVSIFSKTTQRAAVAIGVEVPGRKTIYILGSWNEPSPAVEAQFGDIVRGIGLCKHKPNRGCVPVMPTGSEDELPNPPKAAGNSSPFG